MLAQRGEEAALGTGLIEHGGGAGQLEAALGQQRAQALEELAAEHRRERVHGKQEPALGVQPLPIFCERPAGHQAVQVQVLQQQLVPGVQQ